MANKPHPESGAREAIAWRSAPKIVVIVSHYLPGEKAGGPVQTMANLVELVGDDFEFRIITMDRDHTDQVPYPDVQLDKWTGEGKASVIYLSPKELSGTALRGIISTEEPDLVYVNSVLARQSVRILL